MYFNVIDFVVFYTKSHDIALSSVHHIDNAVGYVFEKYILWKLRLRLYFLFMSQPFFIYTLGCRLVHKGWRSKSGGGKWCILMSTTITWLQSLLCIPVHEQNNSSCWLWGALNTKDIVCGLTTSISFKNNV